jgi:hypothetical protein
MRYTADVRTIMQQERSMARDLPVRLGRTRFYDHVVKLQSFNCPADASIADAAPTEQQQQLRSCLQDLKVDVGWVVAADARLVARADADMLLSGFYVSFAGESGPTFLDELVNTDCHLWHPPSAARLCFVTPGGAAPLMPLWSGTLDLQSNPSGKSCGCQLATFDTTSTVDLTCDKSTEIDNCRPDFPAFWENAKRAMLDKCWRTQGDLVGVDQFDRCATGTSAAGSPRPPTPVRCASARRAAWSGARAPTCTGDRQSGACIRACLPRTTPCSAAVRPATTLRSRRCGCCRRTSGGTRSA